MRLLLAACTVVFCRPVLDERVEGWRGDLLHLAEEMERLHPDLFHGVSREEFEDAVGKLDERFGELDDDQIVVELMRLVALTGRDGREGHAGVLSARFHVLPLQLHRFEDGWFVVAAREPHSELAGSRVLAIGGTPIAEACQRLAPLLACDNDADRLSKLALVLLQTEVLHVLGLSGERDRAALELERAGACSTVSLNGIDAVTYRAWAGFSGRLPAAGGARWLTGTEHAYRLEVLEPERALYIQYNAVQAADEQGHTLRDFAAELVRTFHERGLERVVLDVRSNGGGDNTTFGPLLDALAADDAIDRRGTLYCLIGRKTFSAAGNFAWMLGKRTRAIFVGEPTGGAPDQYGDSRSVVLAHHPELEVHIATRWHDFGGGAALATEPDLPVPLTSADYFAGRDPVLRAALEHAEPGASPDGRR